jgi:hypothetical protein
MRWKQCSRNRQFLGWGVQPHPNSPIFWMIQWILTWKSLRRSLTSLRVAWAFVLALAASRYGDQSGPLLGSLEGQKARVHCCSHLASWPYSELYSETGCGPGGPRKHLSHKAMSDTVVQGSCWAENQMGAETGNQIVSYERVTKPRQAETVQKSKV